MTKKTVASAMVRVRAWWPEQEGDDKSKVKPQGRRAEKMTLATMQRRSARRSTNEGCSRCEAEARWRG